jgi:hypothetical protein
VRRFLLFWLVLGATQWLATTALELGVLKALDWRYQAFCEVILLPAIQSAALCAVLPRPERAPWPLALRRLAAVPAVLILLTLDATLLAAGWLVPRSSLLSLTRSPGIPAVWCAAKLAMAALLTVAVAVRPEWRSGERASLLAGAAAALAAAAQTFPGWIGPLSERLLPRATLFVRGIAVYGGLSVLAIAVLLLSAATLSRLYPVPGQILEAATMFPVAALTIAVLSYFLRPWMTPPWDALAKTFSYLGATAVLVPLLAVRTAPAPEAVPA